jgi:hypothetical protein
MAALVLALTWFAAGLLAAYLFGSLSKVGA